MYDSWFWFVYRRTSSRQNLQRFHGFDEHDSQELGCQANIRETKGPSLNQIHVKLPHQRSPYAVKIEDKSQEKTERQGRCARGDAWRLAKNIYKLKEKEKASFFSPTHEWIFPAASTTKREERDCGGLQSKHACGQQERP